MSNSEHLRRLAKAQRHVQGGRRIVAAQEALVAEMKAKGEDTRLAESLLDSFRRSQAIFEDDARDLSARD